MDCVMSVGEEGDSLGFLRPNLPRGTLPLSVFLVLSCYDVCRNLLSYRT